MEKMFQNPTIQELFPSEGLLTELCTILLKEVKQANPLKWVNHATSASNEVNEVMYWKDQIDSIMFQIKTKLYTDLDEIFGEMQNLFQEVEDEVAQAAQDVDPRCYKNGRGRLHHSRQSMRSKMFQAKLDVTQAEEIINVQ